MLKERKVGKWFRIEGRISGERIRLGLRTQHRGNARNTIADIERALAEGPGSFFWPKLQSLLPEKAFERIAAIAGYQERPTVTAPTWQELVTLFESECGRRIALGKLRASTFERYKFEMNEATEFFKERGIDTLERINRATIEEFKMWRVARIRSRSKCAEAKSIVLSAAILHRVFGCAVENEMVLKNPVRLEGRPGGEPERGSQPFKPEEIHKLREHAGTDALAFALLRRTGLRGSDAVALTWADIDFEAKELIRVTQKRGKRVVIPIHTELLFMLEVERKKRDPQPWEPVLLNPETGSALTRPRLYERMMALGRRAGVANSNPHRFRDTLAVELLGEGCTPYDVAKVLGDTIETVENHYAPFVRELRDRVRRIMESVPDSGNVGTIRAQSSTKRQQVQ
jgi:integrase